MRLPGYLVLCLAFGLGTATAQAQLRTYDGFGDLHISPDRWLSANNRLDSTENERYQKRGSVHFENRSYAPVGTKRIERVGLYVADSKVARKINQMSVRLRVNRVKLKGCPISTGVTRAFARLEGFWFNDGTGTSTTGSLGDVFAGLRVERSETSTGAGNVLDVKARVVRCISNDCGQISTLFDETISTMRVKQWKTLEIEHKKGRKSLFFRLGGREVVYKYGDDNITAKVTPNSSWRAIRIETDVERCDSNPSLAYAEASASFDWVKVNANALPR